MAVGWGASVVSPVAVPVRRAVVRVLAPLWWRPRPRIPARWWRTRSPPRIVPGPGAGTARPAPTAARPGALALALAFSSWSTLASPGDLNKGHPKKLHLVSRLHGILSVPTVSVLHESEGGAPGITSNLNLLDGSKFVVLVLDRALRNSIRQASNPYARFVAHTDGHQFTFLACAEQ